MQVEILSDAGDVARAGASRIAAEARDAVAARGRFLLAVSGGTTPWAMLRALAWEEIPWPLVHIFQVDERLAPDGHSDRNLTHLRENLLARAPLPPGNVHAMPVTDPDPERAASVYARRLESAAGIPPILDLVHLGLGADGHTASLVPGDPVLDVTDRDVAVTNDYMGRRRMTLTFPALNRARNLLFLVTGRDRRPALGRLLAGDPAIPAGRVRPENALLLVDHDAFGVEERAGGEAETG